LEPGQSKDARFEMKVKGNGTFNTLINVKFTPDTGSGVGLSATIIVISSGSADDSGADTEDGSSDNSGADNTDTGNTSSNNAGVLGSLNNLRLSLSPVIIAGIITFALLVIFLILLIIWYRKSKKAVKVIKVTKLTRKRAGRSS
jgi:hypothetical protein